MGSTRRREGHGSGAWRLDPDSNGRLLAGGGTL